MVGEIAKEFPNRVYPLNFHGTLEKQKDYATPYSNYTKYWENELHATYGGFDLLGEIVRKQLEALGVK
jgi:hypothetical protein